MRGCDGDLRARLGDGGARRNLDAGGGCDVTCFAYVGGGAGLRNLDGFGQGLRLEFYLINFR